MDLMTDFSILGRGWLLGLAIAAPVGPIGILCIKRSLTQGWRFGLVSGLGAATADGIYGCIAGFGLTVVSQFLVAQQFWLQLVGGLFLIYLGIRTLREALAQATHLDDNPPEDNTPSRPLEVSLFKAYSSTLLLTLTNPVTILSFAAMFAGLGMTTSNRIGSSLLVSGVFSGSACWWLLLCSGVSLLRQRIASKQLRWINGASAGILLVFGIGAVMAIA